MQAKAPPTQAPPQPPAPAPAGPVSALAVMDKVRAALKKRGDSTIRGLGRVFREMTSYDEWAKRVDTGEFAVGMRDIGLSLSPAEENALFNLLDRDHTGTVDFDEFLIGVRGKPNQRRQAMIDKAFLKFDKDCTGVITVKDLKGVYNAKAHPKVQQGKMTEDEVFLEFLKHFGAGKDGNLTKDEWNDYYAAVSASVDNDDHFILLMKNAWKLD